MGEKRFTLNMMKKPSEIEMDGKMISKYDVVRLLNTLHQENHYLSTIRENQQQIILKLKEENKQLQHYKLYEDNKRLQTIIADLKEENEQLRTQLLQQSNDDGRFQVWEVPPIQKGTRISFTTNDDGGDSV